MLKKQLFTSILLVFISIHSFAAGYYYDFNARCQKAYQSLMAFKLVEGNQMLAAELKENPYNLIPVFLGSYDDLVSLLFVGDPAELKRRKNNLDIRLAKLERGDKNSPWHLYTRAALQFHWAAINLRFNEMMSGANLFRKSYNNLKDNQRLFPKFPQNQILLGVAEGVIGTVPDNYKWIANLLGFKGSVKSGNTKIVNFLNAENPVNDILREETIVYYCYFKSVLFSEPAYAFEYLDGNKIDVKNNYFFAFTKANIALNSQRSTLAMRTLQNMNKSSAYISVPIFDFEMGQAALGNLDDDCIAYFNRFLNTTKNSYFIKETYQKMSLYYWAMGNNAKANLYLNKCLTLGTAITDADKQALRFAKAGEFPNPIILKAHLLCDGGNYTKAQNILSNYSITDFKDIPSQLEFTYRMAQISSGLGINTKAIEYYKQTINLGKDRKEHFAARSALEIGNIYEDMGQKALAISFYNQCINMKGHDYENALEQKAKAGIDRLK